MKLVQCSKPSVDLSLRWIEVEMKRHIDIKAELIRWFIEFITITGFRDGTMFAERVSSVKVSFDFSAFILKSTLSRTRRRRHAQRKTSNPFSSSPPSPATTTSSHCDGGLTNCQPLRRVNNTDGSPRPQSVSRDGGTSNGAVAAAFIPQTCRPFFHPLFLCFHPFIQQRSRCFLLLPGVCCAYGSTRMHNSTLLPVSYSNTHLLMCVCGVWTCTWQQPLCAIVRVLSENVKRIVALWRWVKYPRVEGIHILSPEL